MYDAVVFDLDGVLAHPTPDTVLETAACDALKRVGVEPTPRAVRHARSSDLGRARRLCAAHGLDPDAYVEARDAATTEAQAAALEDGRKPLYDDVDLLGTLLDRGVSVGVVSNNQQAFVDRAVEHAGLAVSFASGRERSLAGLRRKKPRPYYLDRALSALDVTPARALYVGDQTKDLLAARAAGTDAAFVRRPHREDYRVGVRPDHEVRTLRGLPVFEPEP